jgi:hypothetical protein
LFNSLKNKSKIFVPSLANLIFLVLFLSLSLSKGGFLLSDADTGWHIKAGEFMLDTFSVLRHDIFSFTTPPLDWLNHQWLSEVIMALIHQSWGLTGIVIFFALIISFTYTLLFRLMQKDQGNIIVAVFIVLLTIASSIFHWLARPHIFSLLFLTMGYYLLDLFHHKHVNLLYFFPPMMFFWINMHSGFIFGFILIFIYLMGNLLRFITSKDETRELYKQRTKLLILTMVASFFISLINPYGLNSLINPFTFVSNKFIMNHMSEFQSPNFHNPILWPFNVFLLLMIFVIGLSKKNLNIIEILLLVIFIGMGLFSQRFIPFLCIVAAPILVRNVDWMLKGMHHRFVDVFKKKSDDLCSMDASARGYLWFVGGVLMIVIALVTNKIVYQFDENEKPVAAVNFLKKVSLEGNMFNDDEFGDYIIYSAFPRYKVFIDSRVDMYGPDRLKDYLHMVSFKPGWEDIVEKYSINWVFFNSDSMLSRHLRERNDWKLIYSDRVANIFIKNIPENQEIIKRYGNFDDCHRKTKYLQ